MRVRYRIVDSRSGEVVAEAGQAVTQQVWRDVFTLFAGDDAASKLPDLLNAFVDDPIHELALELIGEFMEGGFTLESQVIDAELGAMGNQFFVTDYRKFPGDDATQYYDLLGDAWSAMRNLEDDDGIPYDD